MTHPAAHGLPVQTNCYGAYWQQSNLYKISINNVLVCPSRPSRHIGHVDVDHIHQIPPLRRNGMSIVVVCQPSVDCHYQSTQVRLRHAWPSRTKYRCWCGVVDITFSRYKKCLSRQEWYNGVLGTELYNIFNIVAGMYVPPCQSSIHRAGSCSSAMT